METRRKSFKVTYCTFQYWRNLRCKSTTRKFLPVYRGRAPSDAATAKTTRAVPTNEVWQKLLIRNNGGGRKMDVFKTAPHSQEAESALGSGNKTKENLDLTITHCFQTAFPDTKAPGAPPRTMGCHLSLEAWLQNSLSLKNRFFP